MGVKTKQLDADGLQGFKIFAELSNVERADILSGATIKEIKAGAFLLRNKSKGDEVFFLIQGRAKVCRADAKGKEVIIGLLSPGAIIGEIAALTGVKRTADVIALSRCRVLEMSRINFLKQVAKHPAFALALLRSLAILLGRATTRISDLSLNDVNARVAHVLVEMGTLLEDEGEEVLVIRERPTHQTLASMVGASRETVTRALGELEADGHIRIDGERVLIFSMPE